MSHINLANAFKAACLAELEALKPGNVHIFADGHGMTVQDFLVSAEAASENIALPDLSLGERILFSVQATQKVVNLNTNLGIILLCAPIIQAVIQAKLRTNKTGLQANIHAVLAASTVEDAEACFASRIAAKQASASSTLLAASTAWILACRPVLFVRNLA